MGSIGHAHARVRIRCWLGVALAGAAGSAIYGCGGAGTSTVSPTAGSAASAGAVVRPVGLSTVIKAPQRIAVPLAKGDGGEGSGGIVLVDPSGRRVATLTRPRAGWEDSEPAWSPDGARLAFTRTTDGRRSFQIYVMRADGTGVRRITRGRFDTSPAWSPDGRWIAYRSNYSLRIVHPDGSGGRVVPTGSPTDVGYPAWAPGGRIAYSYFMESPSDWPAACRRAGSTCGWVVSSRLDGSQRRRVVRGRDAHWSPDGRAIVYTGANGGVYTAAGSGAGGHMLGRGYLAEWSHDGTQIAYARLGATPAQDSVWIMNRDGRNAHRILVGGTNPSWRP